MALLITGGAGFIGSNFIHYWFENFDELVVNVDKLTYGGHLENLAPVFHNSQHIFVCADISDEILMTKLLSEYQPRAILHFAAESHVDRSIESPESFIQTNIVGTFQLLNVARFYYDSLAVEQKKNFRFLHVSTDEVYGSLEKNAPAFTEYHPYKPNNPYSASKAASDHWVRAYQHTYGLPVLITHCSNNYGPYQFPEKLIPRCLINAFLGKVLPIYGDGQHIRDWLYVRDHCSALLSILEHGKVGETYNIGGGNERSNFEVVEALCLLLDELNPRADGCSYRKQIAFVEDRPGHDLRYAIDARKLEHELGWKPSKNFEMGLRQTVEWYLANDRWVAQVLERGCYEVLVDKH